MENKIKRMLTEEPILTMISCSTEAEKGNPVMKLMVQSKYPKKKEFSNIPEERRKGLETLFYKNPRKAIDEILRYRFSDREIVGMYEGDASLILPTRECPFYRKCTSFETHGYQIYFNDYAISVFKNTILRLDEKSKRDSFQFIKRKIESGESQHLHLSISDGFQNTRSRMTMQLANKGHNEDPENALYYYTNLLQDGTVDLGDLKNILELIEIFVQMYGPFGMITQDGKNCVGYNVGSLKVTGIDAIPEMYQKVYSLRKREE